MTLQILLIIILGILSYYDYIYFVIPNLLIFFLFTISIINLFYNGLHSSYLIGLVFGFVLFLIFYILFPKGIGFGDVKLAGAIGLFLGLKLTVLAILLSFFSGAVVGLLLIALGKKSMKDPIPFGPFLAFGAITSLFFGDFIINWYMNLFI